MLLRTILSESNPYLSAIRFFWFALASAIVEIGVQFLWGLAQFTLNVEDRLLAVLLPEITKPGNDPDYASRIINPVLDEFITPVTTF